MPKKTADGKPVAADGAASGGQVARQGTSQALAEQNPPPTPQQSSKQANTRQQQLLQQQLLLQQQQAENPTKKVKREYPDPPTPARAVGQPVVPDPQATAPGQKRARQPVKMAAPVPAGSAAAPAEPAPARSAPAGSSPRPKHPRPRRTPPDNFAWVVSRIRTELEAIQDVEGVRDSLDKFPEVVVVGGIAARRELVAALIGECGHATSIAATLVAPGLRQPLALELRWSNDVDLDDLTPDAAAAWLQDLGQTAARAVGSKIRVDVHRLRLGAMGVANLDIVQLPEPAGGAGAVPQKIEEIRQKYLASPANLIACCEPGSSLDLCKRFDPQMRRTVLVGAASESEKDDDGAPLAGVTQSAVTLCGSAAARALEERFQKLCKDRSQQWLADLERMELRLKKSGAQARDVEQNERAEEVLARTRVAGMSFAHAFQQVRFGALPAGFRTGPSPLLGCTTGAATLEDELTEFATAAKAGQCGVGAVLSPEDAAKAVNDLFAHFGGVAGYAAYLRKDVKIHGADESLNGEAAWQRLVVEIEVAMRLSHPPQEKLSNLALSAVRCGGTGVHGHQRWEDVASKLMMAIAFDPLKTRVQYIAARVVWALRQQKALVAAWMATSSEGPSSMFQGSIFAKHIALMRSSPISRERIFHAYDGAAVALAEQVLKYLQNTLMAGCISPNIMLRPCTNPDMDPSKMTKLPDDQKTAAARTLEAKQRVKTEMLLREGRGSGTSGGLPKQLRDTAFEPTKAFQSLPHVEVMLRKAYRVLAEVVANQAVAFVDAAMNSFSRSGLELAMTNLDFTQDQWRVLNQRYDELHTMRKQVDDRLDALNRCTKQLRQASFNAGMGPGGA